MRSKQPNTKIQKRKGAWTSEVRTLATVELIRTGQRMEDVFKDSTLPRYMLFSRPCSWKSPRSAWLSWSLVVREMVDITGYEILVQPRSAPAAPWDGRRWSIRESSYVAALRFQFICLVWGILGKLIELRIFFVWSTRTAFVIIMGSQGNEIHPTMELKMAKRTRRRRPIWGKTDQNNMGRVCRYRATQGATCRIDIHERSIHWVLGHLGWE